MKSREKLTLVSTKQYSSPSCWKHEDGNFRALLLLGKQGNYAVPEFISVNCLVIGENTSDAGSVIYHIGTIRMVDLHGQLQKKFPAFKIGGNVASDQPFPSGNSELYYFKAKLVRVPHPYQKVYSPSRIERLASVRMSFREFQELSREEREALLQSLE